jgi:hypothetical protein
VIKYITDFINSMPRWFKITLAVTVLISSIPAIFYSWIVVFSMLMNKYELIDLTHRNCITKTEFLKYHEASKKYYEYLTINSYKAMGDKMRYTELQLDLIVKDISSATTIYTNAKYTPAIALETQADVANSLYIFKSEMKAISRDDYKNVDIDIYNTSDVIEYCINKSESGFSKGAKSISDHYSNSDIPISEIKVQLLPLVPLFKKRIYDCYNHAIQVQKDNETNIQKYKTEYENSIPFK